MRALIALLLSLLALDSPAFAAKKKVVEVTPSPSCYPIGRVTRSPKGYRLVTVRLSVPVPEDKDPIDVARRATFIFGLHFPVKSSGFKQVRTEWLIGAMTCRENTLLPEGFFRAGPVWFRMRTLVGEVKGDSYILETYLWLPANVIKSKPRAETRLNTGVGYQGEWTVGESNELFLRPRPPDD